MFNKTSDVQPAPTSQPKAARYPVRPLGVPSVISMDIKIVVNLQFAGDIQIE